jgi:predicted CoA-binding protein
MDARHAIANRRGMGRGPTSMDKPGASEVSTLADASGPAERVGVDRERRDAELAEILATARTIAVVGIKAGESDDAWRVPKYLQDHGFAIVPVNPKLDRVLGKSVFPDLRAVQSAGLAIDIVNLFRASDKIPDHVDEILALSPRPDCVWMQLGIQHGVSAARLRAAGIRVVQDRCIMVDHRRLIGAGPASPGEP